MGQKQSIDQSKLVDHARFQKVRIDQSLQNEYHCATIQIYRTIPNFQIAQMWVNNLKRTLRNIQVKQSNSSYSHIVFSQSDSQTERRFQSLLIPIKYSWTPAGICGQGGLLKIQYEDFMFDLQQQIQNRIQMKKYFLQTQIWFLLYKLVQLLKEFQQSQTKIGNIHPKNILVNDDGLIKVVAKCSVFDQLDNYEQKIQNLHAKAFLAPQQIQPLNENITTYPKDLSKSKAEIFSLGITILCAATLTLGEQFYQIDSTTSLISLSISHLQKQIQSLSEHYSGFLYSVVQSMLKLQKSFRRQATQIYYSLKLYETEILQLHPFLPTFHEENKQIAKVKQRQENLKTSNGYLIYGEHQTWRQSQQQRLNGFYKRFNI